MGWGKRQISLQATRTAAEDYAAFEAVGLSEMEDARVLDVGCFDGYNTLLKFSPYSNISEVVGIDPCAEEIAEAEKRAADERFKFEVSSFEDYESPELFDLVYFSHVMQHLENPLAACERAYRLLKPGGWIVVKTVDDSLKLSFPDPENAMRRLFSLYERYVLPETEHTRFTDRYYGQKGHAHLRQTGFEDVQVRLFSSDTVGKTREERRALFERCVYFRRNVPNSVDAAIADRVAELVRKWGALFDSDDYYFLSQSVVLFGRKPCGEAFSRSGDLPGEASEGFSGSLSEVSEEGASAVCKAGNLRIRPMTESDLGAVMAIEVESFPAPWTPVAFAMDLRHNPASRYRVAVSDDGRIVGYVGWWLAGGSATVMRIASDRKARRSGVGGVLLEQACAEAARSDASVMQLEVRSSNEAARAFYGKHGFGEEGRIPGYYSRPDEDAVVLLRVL